MKMLSRPTHTLQAIVFVTIAATAGALAGSVTAFYVRPAVVTTVISPSPVPLAVSTPTSTVSEPALVRLEPRLAEPRLPPDFLPRRGSPVASVYHRARGVTVEERTLNDDRLLGQAVALTSDGWFVAVSAEIGNTPLTELTLWHAGKSFAVSAGVADRINGTVYLKIKAQELPVPAFADVLDVVLGSGLWLERRSFAFAPSLVTALTDRRGFEAISSEIASRRLFIDGLTSKGDIGAPVWDTRGALLGLIDSAIGEQLRFIPATSISSSFSSLLSTGGIHHASLGVRTIDLAGWRIDGDRGSLPMRGAYVHDDRKTGKPAFAKESPAGIAGIKAGDVIISIDRDVLDGVRDLGEILSEYRPGARVVLHVLREGRELDISVMLGDFTTSEPLK